MNTFWYKTLLAMSCNIYQHHRLVFDWFENYQHYNVSTEHYFIIIKLVCPSTSDMRPTMCPSTLDTCTHPNMCADRLWPWVCVVSSLPRKKIQDKWPACSGSWPKGKVNQRKSCFPRTRTRNIPLPSIADLSPEVWLVAGGLAENSRGPSRSALKICAKLFALWETILCSRCIKVTIVVTSVTTKATRNMANFVWSRRSVAIAVRWRFHSPHWKAKRRRKWSSKQVTLQCRT